MKNKARAIIISSVSGGGKTTLIKEIIQKYPEFEVAITATSRKPRAGEIEGVHYYFMDMAAFKSKIEDKGFLEYANVHGNYYGVPKGPVMEAINAGKSIILNIDMQGMRIIKEKLGELVFTIFIMPPDLDLWESRLRNRKTENEEQIRKRLQQGALELESAFEYDYRIINNELDVAVGDLIDIFKKEGVI